MPLETFPFEAERYFQTPEAQVDLVTDAWEAGDPAYLTHAIGIVARARGIAEVARATGLSRQALYAAFGPKGNPTIGTVMKVLRALEMTLEIRRAA